MTARLIGRTGKARGIEQAVGEMLTVGSEPGNELSIESRTVSRRHAQIVRSGADYYVEDLQSRNGTFLNGQRVRRFRVKHLDVLSIGPDIDLVFLETGAPAQPVARAAPVGAAITWISGPFAGRVEEVSPDRGLVLGRGSDIELAGVISRSHAVVSIRGDHVTVEDLQSTNGTWIDGRRIDAVTRLADRAVVSLANLIEFRVSIFDGGAAATGRAPLAIDRQQTLTIAADSAVRRGGTLVMGSPEPVPLVRPAADPAASTSSAAAPPALSEPEPARETVAVPPEPGKVPAAVAGGVGDVASDHTVAAPRVELPGGFRSGPAKPREPADLEPQTSAVRPQGAGAAPSAVFADAMAARESIGNTTRAEDDRRAEAAGVPPPVPRPANEPPAGAGPIIGVELVGGQRIPLNSGVWLVGRDPQADVCLESRDVGRRHAKVHVGPDGVRIEDLGSSNGTFVDGVLVTGSSGVQNGSRLRFATVEFHVVLVRGEGLTP